MTSPSLFPKFMDPIGGVAAGSDGLIVELAAEPTISVDINPVNVEVVSPVVTIEVIDPPIVEVNE